MSSKTGNDKSLKWGLLYIQANIILEFKKIYRGVLKYTILFFSLLIRFNRNLFAIRGNNLTT